MSDLRSRFSAMLPFSVDDPEDPRRRRNARALRVICLVLLIGVLVTVVVQFQCVTMRNLRRGAEYDRKSAAGELRSDQKRPPKSHKGAIGRWRRAVYRFWEGRNIYRNPPAEKDASAATTAGAESRAKGNQGREHTGGRVWLHPNTPFTVMLLTPFAYLSTPVMALVWNLLKVAVFISAVWMVVRVANHDGRRMPDWVVLLGILWSLLLVVGDFQHGNTNVFVLGAIVLHLWLYRRGRDVASGFALVLAICLKMTPALFVLYWLYQRNWKLLIGVVVAGLIFAVVIPAAAVGPERYVELTGTWLNNLIVPGLVKGSWYPIHINQSVSGVTSRLFLDGKNGDVFWNPDDDPYYTEKTEQHGWITAAALSPEAARTLVRLLQVAIVGLAAWVIGWRKLPRDDGRRALHFALVVIAMLLLNQRTWDHHAGILLVADMAIWYTIAFGRVSPKARAWALGLMLAAGPMVWLTGTGMFKLLAWILGRAGQIVTSQATVWNTRIVTNKPVLLADLWADLAKAYGPTFVHFVLLLVAVAILGVSIRKSQDPYAAERQKL